MHSSMIMRPSWEGLIENTVGFMFHLFYVTPNFLTSSGNNIQYILGCAWHNCWVQSFVSGKLVMSPFCFHLWIRFIIEAELSCVIQVGIDPYAVPKSMGIFRLLESPNNITTSSIAQRIVSNHDAYMVCSPIFSFSLHEMYMCNFQSLLAPLFL